MFEVLAIDYGDCPIVTKLLQVVVVKPVVQIFSAANIWISYGDYDDVIVCQTVLLKNPLVVVS